MSELRKRKKSSENKEEQIHSVPKGNVMGNGATFIELNSAVCLLTGLILGISFGGPWGMDVLDKLRGYRWDYRQRCIMESPNVQEYGVDFCRLPVDCGICKDINTIDEVHISDLTVQQFQERYAHTNRPLVVRNATTHWPAMDTLNYDWLKEQYLSDSAILEYQHEDCWFNRYSTKEFRNLATVFRLPRDWVEMTSGKHWYVGWAVCQEPVARKLFELFERPAFIDPDSTPPSKPWIFIGTPGPGANSHIDNVDLSSWQAQIGGVKKWFLTPPPECWWTCGSTMETTVYPGDIIVLNTNYWFHSTKIIGDQLSVVITNEYD